MATSLSSVPGVTVRAPVSGRATDLLTPEALAFIAGLHRTFNPRRLDLLQLRTARQARLDQGDMPDFLPETKTIREGNWKVSPVPADLQDRRVEITGPVERKMMINALNSGAKVFMADFEDANAPTWENCLQGQVNLIDAVERTIEHTNPDGRVYRLNPQVATLVVRPRGWHLDEKHVTVDGQPISASLFDFGLYFFHNAKRLKARGTGPYFYLPKMENHLEARLWNDVFLHAQQALGVPRGTIKATVLIETILAAYEMDEILFELREHAAGLNAGRWDYLFSIIKKFRNRSDMVLPDRSQLTMAVPFMQAYTQLLVRTCHRRGAHAIGGMAAFIPSRKDAKVNETAMQKVREDKVREATMGFDGTWVAHPDLVPVAQAVFDQVLGENPNQVAKPPAMITVTAKDLITLTVPSGVVTDAGLRTNVDVGLQYIESWLRGVGAAAIHNLMEDAATAEISRSQIWQWVRHGATTKEGHKITRDHVRRVVAEELQKLQQANPGGRWKEAQAVFEQVALADPFVEFLTVPAYNYLE
ncbi:MAG TPA: malate synthase A [Candidatus Thermoplasmatota archaeon]|nr:malate synthase A [Candidatus Thermoplasmatota archaeon]